MYTVFIITECYVVCVLHRWCVGYTFCNLLKRDIAEFKDWWNKHRIRPNTLANCPHGVPEDLYALPRLTGKYS